MPKKFMLLIDRITERWPWTRTAVSILMIIILARQISRPFLLAEPTVIDWAHFAVFVVLGCCFLLLEYFMRVVSPRMTRERSAK